LLLGLLSLKSYIFCYNHIMAKNKKEIPSEPPVIIKNIVWVIKNLLLHPWICLIGLICVVGATNLTKIHGCIDSVVAMHSLHPFKKDTFGILVAEFEGETIINGSKHDGKAMQRSIRDALNARFMDEKITGAKTEDYPAVVKKEEARIIGQKYNAELVIWGSGNIQGIVPNLTLVKNDSCGKFIMDPDTCLLRNTLTPASLANMSDIKFASITAEPISLVYFVSGWKCFDGGLYKDAVPLFTKALDALNHRDSKINAAFISELLGACYYALGQYDQALTFINRSMDIKLNPTYEEYNSRGLMYAAKGNYEKAFIDYNKAIQLKPNAFSAYYNRGTTYAIKGEYDKAFPDYAKAIKLKPDSAETYNNRGIAYSARGDYNRAILDFGEVIKRDPAWVYAYSNRAKAYCDQGDYYKAIGDYTKAIDLKPNDAKFYYSRGTVYSKNGNHEQAVSDITNAIRLNPDFYEAYYNRGLAYDKKGDHDKAIADFTKTIELSPNLAKAYNNRGSAYLGKGNYDLAMNDFIKAIKLDHNLAEAYGNIAAIYYRKNDYTNTWKNVRNAEKYGLKINPEFILNLKKSSGIER